MEDAIVVPLKPISRELSGQMDTETMLLMLLNQDAMLIQYQPSSTTQHQSSNGTNLVAQSAGSFAKAVSLATQQIGHVASDSGLYRVILPAGFTVKDLVPAVGGGFRGITRATGSSAIASHVRLIPATGAAVAAGPMIATVALAMAGDMLSSYQTNKKLDAIYKSVKSLQERRDAEDRAILINAAQQARKVTGYLLDQACIPSMSTAPYAFGKLEELFVLYGERLDKWSDIAEHYSKQSHVNSSDLLKELTNSSENSLYDFECAVEQTYQTFALRARIILLEKVAAEQNNASRSLAHVETILRSELDSIAQRQEQLVHTLESLSFLPVGAAKFPVEMSGKKTSALRSSFFKLTCALHSQPAALPVLDNSDHAILELAPNKQGLEIINPQKSE
ncbi:hypothetical protein JMJ98_08460 [Bifidobacterium adolescentis]|nr:hypothetical protein [Bifidobacterium adolescentis]MCT6790196.1 hypothetical protein [Bifidobacterium adolescentis]NRD15911.1 hypothetical protein [Bifidobacterium adolescentis]SPU23398.1 filamentous hemagglutinin [Bifidobacterium adolescentis]